MTASNTQTVIPRSPRNVNQAAPKDMLARARKLLAGVVGIDSHIDTIQRVLVMR